MNQYNVIGNLGDDAQVHPFDNGDIKVSFSVATPDNYKDDSDNWVDRVQWSNWECSKSQADKIRHWKKGYSVRCTGKMRNVKFVHENVTKYKVVYHVAESELISKKEKKEEAPKNRY